MSPAIRILIALLTGVVTGPLGPPASADPADSEMGDASNVTAVALEGEATPVGGSYLFDGFVLRPSRVLMDAAGRVYFRSRIDGGMAPDGLFRAVGERVEALVLAGDTAPETGGLVFDGFGTGMIGLPRGAQMAVSRDGELVFSANFRTLPQGRTGIFATDGATLRKIALDGEPAAGLPAVPLGLSPLAINDAGDVLAAGSLSDRRLGLFLFSGGRATPIVFNGDDAPGTNGGRVIFTTLLAALDEDGSVVLSVAVVLGSAGEAMYDWRDGELAPILLEGDPVPDVEGAVFRCTPNPPELFPFFCAASAFGEPGLNDPGTITFRGNYQETETDLFRGGIFRIAEHTVEAIALEGDAVAGTDQALSSFDLGPPATSASGVIGFAGSMNLPAQEAAAARDGIFAAGPENGVEARLLSGAPAPGTPGLVFSSFETPVGIDRTGRRLAVLTHLNDLRRGIYVATKNGAPVAEAGPDQQLECEGPEGSLVVLDAGGSRDPDEDALAFTWTGPFAPASGATTRVRMPVGDTTVLLTAEDEFGGSSSDVVSVSVVDSRRPAMNASLTPDPARSRPRGRRGFRVRIECHDGCDASPVVTATFGGRAVRTGDLVHPSSSRGQPLLEVHCEDHSGNATNASVGPGTRRRGR